MKHPERFIEIVEHIKAQPETWDQHYWHSECGTKHCLAGWAQIRAGYPPDDYASVDAQEYLGLTDFERGYLFAACRTMEDFEVAVAGIKAGERFIYHGTDADGISEEERIVVDVRGGVAYCDDPRVLILHPDNENSAND